MTFARILDPSPILVRGVSVSLDWGLHVEVAAAERTRLSVSYTDSDCCNIWQVRIPLTELDEAEAKSKATTIKKPLTGKRAQGSIELMVGEAVDRCPSKPRLSLGSLFCALRNYLNVFPLTKIASIFR